jgi:hypothetical protein
MVYGWVYATTFANYSGPRLHNAIQTNIKTNNFTNLNKTNYETYSMFVDPRHHRNLYL